MAPAPGLEGLLGSMVDLACEPLPSGDGPRFGNHGAYVAGISRQAARLVRQELLLPSDAQRLRQSAARSQVGQPGTCDP